ATSFLLAIASDEHNRVDGRLSHLAKALEEQHAVDVEFPLSQNWERGTGGEGERSYDAANLHIA
ncbi:MAG TPA: hypothetical protein VFL91_28085, partial [Thermomicrobiales bacterium]|nr:hypothetical protein [Thermomicrobiales bacterium]